MITKNKISAELAPADKNTLMTQIAEMRNKLPFLVNLTPSERSLLRKMGNKSVAYVLDCLRAAQTVPATLPPTVSLQEFEKDVRLFHDLSDLLAGIKTLKEGLEDTIMAAGSDAMITSDLVYGYLKHGAKQDTNLKALVEQLSARHKKSKKKDVTEG